MSWWWTLSRGFNQPSKVRIRTVLLIAYFYIDRKLTGYRSVTEFHEWSFSTSCSEVMHSCAQIGSSMLELDLQQHLQEMKCLNLIGLWACWTPTPYNCRGWSWPLNFQCSPIVCRHWIRVVHAGTGSGPDFTYTGLSETHRIKATAILNQGHTWSGPYTQAA
jgi:hypothetical protein